jgi:hypothetical protein
MRSGRRFVGIDLGARALHVVTLTDADAGRRLAVHDAQVLTPDALDGLADLAAGATAIAIDAPAGPSVGAHVDDAGLAPKFRTARCGEIALGRQAHIWVPWPTPIAPADAPGWMQVGFAAWAVCRAHGPEPLEVYPAGAFRVLAGGRVAPKSTPAGLDARRALLTRVVTPPPGFAMWSHDGLDAMVAALTAADHARGRATGHGHTDPGCDTVAVWLPAARADEGFADPAG